MDLQKINVSGFNKVSAFNKDRESVYLSFKILCPGMPIPHSH
jgi:hypothetical protein